MIRKLIVFFVAITFFSSGAKAQIIDKDCPFDYFPTVVFEQGSFGLTKASRLALDSFANYLIYNPTCSVKIIGSNKSEGRMVKKRLSRVMEYLQDKRVRESQFVVTYSTSLPTTRIKFSKTL